MINDFLKKTIDMLHTSDIKIHIPNFNKVELSGDKKTVFLELTDYIGQTRLEDNLIFSSMIFFTLVDTYVDIQYPYLEGYSFKQKYLKLPKTNDKEIIIKETYRILKIIRNATIHSRNSIILNNENILIVDYINERSQRATNFKLSISKYGLELIYTLIFLCLNQDKYCDFHQLGILRTLYDDILYSISKISDDINRPSLISISNEIRLERNVRYVIMNPDYTVDTTKGLLIINKPQFQEGAIDYIIDNESDNYIIPDEALNEEGVVVISEMGKWILEKDSHGNIMFKI